VNNAIAQNQLHSKEPQMKLLLKPILIAALLGSASFAFAAETPFAGTWKLNLDKSTLTGDTVKFSSVAGTMRMTGGGESYEFKPDGTESKTRFGTAAWKKIDDNTWEETDMVKGRLDSKTTWTLSDDGKTLTARVTGDKPGGGSFDDTSTYVRTAGTNGLTGTWKDKEFKGSSPSLLTLTDSDNGLTFDEPDFKLKAVGKFDGKPGTVEGPYIPPGASFVLTKAGPRSFKMTRTQNGKPLDMATWTVSADGKSMTVVSRTAGTTDPPITEVYEKQ
jgi:hypothetical protein